MDHGVRVYWHDVVRSPSRFARTARTRCMHRLPPKYLWLILALAAETAVVVSLILTAWLDLRPCPLCIFQRLLFMVIGVFGLVAFLTGRHGQRLVGGLILTLCALGAGVAGYQSWMQAQPPGSFACMGGELGLIERLVDWLGQQVPALFLATGFCDEVALDILGLSLANWALIAFITFFVFALAAISRRSSVRD